MRVQRHLVVAIGGGAREPKTGHIDTNDAVLVPQHRGPAVPGVQARGRAVQQDDGLRIVTRAFVAQMHLHAIHQYKLGRRWGPPRSQVVHRPVRRPDSSHAGNDQQHQGAKYEAENFEFVHAARGLEPINCKNAGCLGCDLPLRQGSACAPTTGAWPHDLFHAAME